MVQGSIGLVWGVFAVTGIPGTYEKQKKQMLFQKNKKKQKKQMLFLRNQSEAVMTIKDRQRGNWRCKTAGQRLNIQPCKVNREIRIDAGFDGIVKRIVSGIF